MEPYIDFIGALLNGGFLLVKVKIGASLGPFGAPGLQ